MTPLPHNVLHYGTEDPPPERRPLRAGPLALLFENGDLRYVRLGEREVVRRIYVAVRDRNWGTVAPRLSKLRVDEKADSFRITFEVDNRQGDIDFAWKGDVTGQPDGTISFGMEGEARASFLKNRIGFCILHPIRECAGARVVYRDASGESKEGAFPVPVSPHQPFLDLRSFSHEVTPDVWAELEFEGDLFEMEDQRNWTDASYKTYCTPLRLGYPVEIRQGTKVIQRVTLKLRSENGLGPLEEAKGSIRVTLDPTQTSPLPEVGLGVSGFGFQLNEKTVERLKALRLSHLRVDLPLSESDSLRRFEVAVSESEALGLPLEVAVHLSDNADMELDGLIRRVNEHHPRIRRWIIFHEREKTTAERWVNLARERLRSVSSAPVGSGTDADFVDLNRFRPDSDASDFICYPMNPQVHAFDHASLVETLEAQASTVETASGFTGDKPLVVSPVTLKRRFNPDATGPETPPAPGELPPQVDPRQMSLFGAGWTLGSLRSLAQTGRVESITYYETMGWRGVVETEEGPPVPGRFRSVPGGVYPMYHVFADVGEFAGGEVVHTVSSRPLTVQGLALKKDGKLRILLANFTPDIQTVRVDGLSHRVILRELDGRNAECAMRSPEAFRNLEGTPQDTCDAQFSVTLPPFALLRIDSDETAGGATKVSREETG